MTKPIEKAFKSHCIDSRLIQAKVREHTKLEVTRDQIRSVVWGMEQAENTFNAEEVYPWIALDVDEDMRIVMVVISALIITMTVQP